MLQSAARLLHDELNSAKNTADDTEVADEAVPEPEPEPEEADASRVGDQTKQLPGESC